MVTRDAAGGKRNPKAAAKVLILVSYVVKLLTD
jgi:hypothetical protein